MYGARMVVGATPASPSAARRSPIESVPQAVGALWLQSEGRKIGMELMNGGIPVMVLKGPDLQQRLFGTPAAYVSSDVDMIVRRADARRARRHLTRSGWSSTTE